MGIMLANRYMMEGAYEKAIKEYKKSLESGESKGLTRCRLIIAYILNGSHDTALDEFAKILLQNELIHIEVLRSDEICAMSHKAIAVLMKKLKKEPTNVSLRNSLGISFYLSNMKAQAIAEWQASLNLKQAQPNLSKVLDAVTTSRKVA